MNDESLKNLSMKVFDGLEGRAEYDWKAELRSLSRIDYKDFLVYNFMMFPPTYLDRLMFNTLNYWKVFSLYDWSSIIEQTSSNRLAIEYCLSFLYKFIGIDSLKWFNALPFIDGNLKGQILEYFNNHKGTLALFERIYSSELKKINLSMEDFKYVQEKLISEGASLASRIPPTKIDFS